MQELLSKII